MALFDAGARGDPFIRGFDDLFQVGICENTFRIGMSDPDDPGVLQCH